VESNRDKVGEEVAYVPPGEGSTSLWVFGELVTCKVQSHQTGGAYSLFETVTQPGGGPPPHVHHREDEGFWVLEGEYEFVVEGRATRAGAGSLVYVPRGKLHTHKNVGEKPGRMLIIQTPGGLYEGFFGEVGEPAADESCPLRSEGPQDMGKIAAIAAGYGIEIPSTPGR
jgi:mannose-6-phosphate isomerase-like protein (cupin superfamily)